MHSLIIRSVTTFHLLWRINNSEMKRSILCRTPIRNLWYCWSELVVVFVFRFALLQTQQNQSTLGMPLGGFHRCPCPCDVTVRYMALVDQHWPACYGCCCCKLQNYGSTSAKGIYRARFYLGPALGVCLSHTRSC